MYFGSPNITKIINPKRFIYCAVDFEKIKQARENYFGKLGGTRAFAGVPLSKATDWIDSYIGKDLDRCVKRIIEVDSDDRLYKIRPHLRLHQEQA